MAKFGIFDENKAWIFLKMERDAENLKSGDIKHDKLHDCMNAWMHVKITNLK